MLKYQVLNSLMEMGVAAVIRAESAEQGRQIASAVYAGGIKSLEITMTVPFAHEVIKDLSIMYKGSEVIIGAGTVLDTETARICILSGAEFIVSPCFSAEIALLCNRYSVLYIPGIMSPTEIVRALECGCSLLKIFPADSLGSKIIRTFSAPFPQAAFMPTGGISPQNASEWIKAGAAVIGAGGSLTKGASCGDFKLVEQTAAAFVTAVNEARAEMRTSSKA